MREIHYNHETGNLPPSLEKVPFLQGMGDSIIDKLLGEAVLLECDPGDTIVEENDETQFFCILLKGAVKIMKDGKEVSRLSDFGEMLGEMALATEHGRSASMIAASHVFCLKVEPEFLDDLSEADRNGFFAQLYRFVVKLLGERLEESSQRIASLEERLREFTGRNDASDDGDTPVFRI